MIDGVPRIVRFSFVTERVVGVAQRPVQVTANQQAAGDADGAQRVEAVCVLDDFLPGTPEFAQSVAEAPTPNHGDGWYWILRSAAAEPASQACNVSTTGGSYGGVGEAADRDSAISACPP